MANPRLFQQLQQLSSAEWKSLDAFVRSPYFNTRSEVPLLLKQLRPYHPDFSRVDKLALQEKIAPEKKYDQKWMNDLFSALSRLVSRFWAIENLLHDQQQYQRAYRHGLRFHLLDHLADRQLKTELQKLENEPVIDMERADTLFSLYDETYAAPSRKSTAAQRKQEVHQLVHYLDLRYLMLKLRFMCDRQTRALTYEEQYEDAMESAVLEKAAQIRSAYPFLDLYYRLYHLYQEEELKETTFLKLKDLLFSLSEQIQTRELGFLITKLSGIAHQQFSQGKEVFAHHLFELYRFGVIHNAFSIGRLFPDTTFLNICTIGSYTRQFEWVEHFIWEYGPRLSPDAADARHLGTATFLFHQRKYWDAHQLIESVLNRQFAYKVRIHSLSVRCVLCLYLKNDLTYRIAIGNLEAFNQYLRRDKEMSPTRKQGYRHFRLAAKRIVQLKNDHWGDAAQKAEVIRAILHQPNVMFKNWLIQQLEDAWPNH